MGSLSVICWIPSNGWSRVLKEMVYTINSVLQDYNQSSDVIISIINNDGANLNVEWDWIGKECPFVSRLINGAIEVAKGQVARLCINCGCDKGLPPSLTVHPAHCEKCRAEFVPESYKDNVIVCMSGKAGSGKDTVADYLVEKYGFKRMAFADPLRDIVQLVFALDYNSVWDRKLRELPLKHLPNYTTNEVVKWYVDEGFKDFPNISDEDLQVLKQSYGWIGKDIEELHNDDRYWSVRKLLQFIGTEMFRNLINRDTWVMNFVQRLEPGVNYVLTDVRFPNEMDWVKTKFGGKVVFTEVVRPGCDGKGVGIENHESERYKLPADIVFQNDGTLEELYKKIENFMNDIEGARKAPECV